MSQISPPIRILLVGAVVLAAAWVLVLKPKDDTSAPAPVAAVTATPTGVARNPNGPAANTGLGRAVQKAEGASQTSDQTNAAIQAASGGDDTTAPSTSAPATQAAPAATTAPSTATESTTKPATTTGDEATDGLPAWVDAALGHKVMAILFWDKSASDDRQTRDAFKSAFAPKHDVVTRVVPITKVADYGKVTRGVDVSQSPTIVFVDKDKNATALVGYSNLDSINQAIIDARLATDNPAKDTKVGRQMAAACDVYRSPAMVSTGDLTTSKSYKAELAGVSHALTMTLKKAPKVSAAGPLKVQAGMLRRLVHSEQGVVGKIRATALNGNAVDATKIRAAQSANDRFEAKATLQLNAVGVTGCQ